MTPDDQRWRTLHTADDPEQAATLATSIQAMEFDVRVRDELAIEVRPEDWVDLQDVLAEIIGEQEEFDTALAHRRHRSDRHLTLVLLVLAVAVLLPVLLVRCG